MRVLGLLLITAVSVECRLAETPHVGTLNGATDAGRTASSDVDDGSIAIADATDVTIGAGDAELERQQPWQAVGNNPPVPGAKLVVRYHYNTRPSIRFDCYWQLPDGGVMEVETNTGCGLL